MASSNTYLVENDGKEPWTAEGPNDDGLYSRISSSKITNNASQQGGNWKKNARRPPKMDKQLLSKLRAKKKLSGSGNKDSWPERNTGKIGTRLGKPEPR